MQPSDGMNERQRAGVRGMSEHAAHIAGAVTNSSPGECHEFRAVSSSPSWRQIDTAISLSARAVLV